MFLGDTTIKLIATRGRVSHTLGKWVFLAGDCRLVAWSITRLAKKSRVVVSLTSGGVRNQYPIHEKLTMIATEWPSPYIHPKILVSKYSTYVI